MEHAYITNPIPTGGTGKNSLGQEFPTYQSADIPEPMKWSGKGLLPNIGDSVLVTMNSLGPAKVVGYYESAGYLGLMVKFDNPPEWFKRQLQNNIRESALATKLGPDKAKIERVRVLPDWILQGIGVVFGAEIRA